MPPTFFLYNVHVSDTQMSQCQGVELAAGWAVFLLPPWPHVHLVVMTLLCVSILVRLLAPEETRTQGCGSFISEIYIHVCMYT